MINDNHIRKPKSRVISCLTYQVQDSRVLREEATARLIFLLLATFFFFLKSAFGLTYEKSDVTNQDEKNCIVEWTQNNRRGIVVLQPFDLMTIYNPGNIFGYPTCVPKLIWT